jgi:Domain of unknown function (DUF4360)
MQRTTLAMMAALFAPAGCTEAPGGPAATAKSTVARTSLTEPGQGTIKQVDFLGDGCDGATAAISEDGEAVTSFFPNFLAVVGPEVPAEQAGRGCLMSTQVEVPQGWSYAVDSVFQRGFAGMEAGVSGSRRAVYQISGNPLHIAPTAAFEGPIDDTYEHRDVRPEAPLGWSKCGGGQNLLIVTEIQANNDADQNATGQLTVDSIDVEVKWRRCD